MTLNQKTAVIGSHILAGGEYPDRSLEELLYEVARGALTDAGLSFEDVDGIVTASNDQFDGRAISVMAASGSVGGVDRDILSTPSASEHAFVMGALRIATGQYETQLVVSWSPTEVSSMSEAQRLGTDPYFHRKLPLDEVSSFALQASALTARAPQATDVASTLTEQSLARGAVAYPNTARKSVSKAAIEVSPSLRWPLREAMLAQPCTGIVALVLASDGFVREKQIKNPAWVQGMGWATEPGFLGDRNLARAPALKEAAKRAYEEAGIAESRSAFDLVELTDASPYQALLVCDELGLSAPDTWESDFTSGLFAPDGGTPMNCSGGVASVNPVFCSGLMRIVEAARQVMGTAGSHQEANVETALAHAASGFAMMYQTVVIFGNNIEGARS